MNIQQIKLLTWTAALAAGAGLGWEVWDFFQRKAELETPLDSAMVEQLLKNQVVEPEPLKDDHVDAGQLKRIFHEMDWSGKAPPKIETPVNSVAEEEKAATPVSSLLMVLAIQQDGDDPSQSLAWVSYTDPMLKAKSKSLTSKLTVSDRLAAPHDNIVVDAITSNEGIRFTFDDDEREAEFVGKLSFPTEHEGIVVVGEGGAIHPVRGSLIRAADPRFVRRNPKVTREWRPGQFRIGTETAERINRDYADILSRLEYRRARNPVDGTVKGIQITKVAPNSIAAEHGLTPGEIVKSINGHPVKSITDAVSYVKKEAATTDVWEVLFEKQGREFTRIYESPQN